MPSSGTNLSPLVGLLLDRLLKNRFILEKMANIDAEQLLMKFSTSVKKTKKLCIIGRGGYISIATNNADSIHNNL